MKQIIKLPLILAILFFLGLSSAFATNDSSWDPSLFTKDMASTSEIIATGSSINKVSTLVSKFGGKAKDWKKKKGWDASGEEWHWYQNKSTKVGFKPAGSYDPF
jgi:hypothetical protein